MFRVDGAQGGRGSAQIDQWLSPAPAGILPVFIWGSRGSPLTFGAAVDFTTTPEMQTPPSLPLGMTCVTFWVLLLMLVLMCKRVAPILLIAVLITSIAAGTHAQTSAG